MLFGKRAADKVGDNDEMIGGRVVDLTSTKSTMSRDGTGEEE
jgi:hypothetical protein